MDGINYLLINVYMLVLLIQEQKRPNNNNNNNCLFYSDHSWLSISGCFTQKIYRHTIGLYRDVWIAAIASSRTRLATLTGAICKTSQCELRSLRVNLGMLNVIRIVTYYTLPSLESPDSFWIAMAISR